MTKTVDALTADHQVSVTETRRSRKKHQTVPSAELVPLQFRMSPDFVKAYKQAALDRNMKLNELLEVIFIDFTKQVPND